MGHGWGAGTAPFYKWLGTGGHREYKNSKEQTDQTVLATRKALTKTTNYTCWLEPKKWRGTTNFFWPFAQDKCSPHIHYRSFAPGPMHWGTSVPKSPGSAPF